MSRLSDQVCDGDPDCAGGEDEHFSICSHRRGRKLSLNHQKMFSDKYDQSEASSNVFISTKNLVIIGVTATVSISMAVLASILIFIYKRKLRRGTSKDFILIELTPALTF